jgi:hypothetical protein
MSKYIDANLLAWKIKRQIRLEKLNFAALGGGGQTFCINTLEWVLKQIDSLQQEQGLIVINKKDWEAQEQFRKNKDFGKPLQQEQQTLDLDADIEMEWDSFSKHLAKYGEESEEVVWLNWYNFNELARHFYELGLKVRKEE